MRLVPEGDKYLPIAEHGIIGDLHSIALVGTDGTIDWYCCPRFDSPSVFGSILDAEQGRPLPDRAGERRLDAEAALLPRHERPDHALPHARRRRRGAGLHADPAATRAAVHRHRLIRRVLGVRGEMRFRVEVEPRFNYARDPHQVVFHESGAVFRSPDLSLALETATPLRPHGERTSHARVHARGRRERDLRPRAGRRGLRPAPVLRGRDARGVRGDGRVLAALARRNRATRAAGARWCTARR